LPTRKGTNWGKIYFKGGKGRKRTPHISCAKKREKGQNFSIFKEKKG